MIYLDHHAASPLAPGVAEAMTRAQAVAWANPASPHRAGQAARAQLESAREAVASAIGARPADVVLTSGGTEACNLGVLGLGKRCRHVVTTAVEHPAVMAAVEELARLGVEVTRVPVRGGRPPMPAAVEAALRPDTGLLAMQWVNHETGMVMPVAEVAERCRRRGVRVFIDASQALGKVPVDVASLGVEALAVAATKVGGPAGAGALYVARSAELVPSILGGAQERGRRAGSPDVVAQAGFAQALSSLAHRLGDQGRLAAERDRLERCLLDAGAVVNGAEGPRVSTVTNVSFAGFRASILVAALDLEGVCAASGPACSSGVDAPSAVISAMYPDAPWRASSSLRLSVGPTTLAPDVDAALPILQRVVSRRA